MVALTIVALLSSLAIANYSIFQSKVRLSKLKLAFIETKTLSQDMLIDPPATANLAFMLCSYEAYYVSATEQYQAGWSGFPASPGASDLCFSAYNKMKAILLNLNPGQGARSLTWILFQNGELSSVYGYIRMPNGDLTSCSDSNSRHEMLCTSPY